MIPELSIALESLCCIIVQGCPTCGPRATLWPTMLSGLARVEIKAVKKLHGGKNFDAITKVHRNYFGSYSIKNSILMICII